MGPRPLDLPSVQEVRPEPVPELPKPPREPEPGYMSKPIPPPPPTVPSRYQPVIFHHEDENNPARHVSVHNLAPHLIPYQHRPDRPDLEPRDPLPEMVDTQLEQADDQGCSDGSMGSMQTGHRVLGRDQH